MVKEFKTYTYICDRCNADSQDGSEHSGWCDFGYAWECAEVSGWKEIDGCHYCPDCYEYDDDDNLIVKKED